MSNRVEDLETQVAELEATIEGLTDELVETKERVHELERQAEEQLDLDVPEALEQEPQTTAEQQAEARGTDERRDAQFVESGPASDEPAAETPPEPETEEADDDDDDEIIVA